MARAKNVEFKEAQIPRKVTARHTNENPTTDQSAGLGGGGTKEAQPTQTDRLQLSQ